MNKKLAIISTHPIQYYAPVFQLLAKELDVLVFYTWGENSMHKYDHGFKQKIEWDLPILEGYNYVFLVNKSKDQGTHHYNGINNKNLISEIEDFKPDAILIYGWAWKSHLKVIRFFKGKVPIYFRGDSTLLNKSEGIKDLIKTIFLKWVYRHIDYSFYVGTANKAYYKKYDLKESQLIFAPHAIDNERFAEDKLEQANLIREKLGLQSEEILILFAGKFEPVKNPTLLLQAFMELSLLNVHLLFVGNGELGKMLKTESEKHKAYDRIHFMGFQNQTQMPAIYQACDLFCLPSRSETWGLAVNEAMASGKAILVSDQVGCAIDLVKSKINGDVFKSEDLTDLKNKLFYLITDKNKLGKLGEASQILIKEWSFGKQVAVFTKIFNS